MSPNDLRAKIILARDAFRVDGTAALNRAKAAAEESILKAVRSGETAFSLAWPTGLTGAAVSEFVSWLQAAGLEVQVGQADRPGDPAYYAVKVRP